MLNAVTNCPNIHWFCHDCNSKNRNVSASIDRINESIGLLTTSLSGDLIQFVDGFKSLTENFMETISTAALSKATSFYSLSSPSACSDKEIVRMSDIGGTPDHLLEKSVKIPQCTTPAHGGSAYKTVVVSNIGNDVTAECLVDYLRGKLHVVKEEINVSLLLPVARTVNDLSFLQYKVTIPKDKYGEIMCLKIWPPNIRVRDFVYKRRITGVSKQNFLSKESLFLSGLVIFQMNLMWKV